MKTPPGRCGGCVGGGADSLVSTVVLLKENKVANQLAHTPRMVSLAAKIDIMEAEA